MSDKPFFAEIRPRKGPEYLNKLFLSQIAVSDPINECPTHIHTYIPIPNEKHPNPNIQIWMKNGAGKILIRFKNPVDLATTLRKIADVVTSDMCLDRFLYAEDLAESLQ